MALIALIDRFVPEHGNPHQPRTVEEMEEEATPVENNSKHDPLMRMGILAAISIAIHNFPEGLATFTAALKDPSLGVAIAIAVAIHNIPEGIAVAVPIFMPLATEKRPQGTPFCQDFRNPWGHWLDMCF